MLKADRIARKTTVVPRCAAKRRAAGFARESTWLIPDPTCRLPGRKRFSDAITSPASASSTRVWSEAPAGRSNSRARSTALSRRRSRRSRSRRRSSRASARSSSRPLGAIAPVFRKRATASTTEPLGMFHDTMNFMIDLLCSFVGEGSEPRRTILSVLQAA